MMQVNEYAVVMGCKYGAESMSKNKAEEWKAIVNTSSIAGFFAMAGIPMPYVGTKFAVRGLTKSAAILGGPLNIRVNSIHPVRFDRVIRMLTCLLTKIAPSLCQ
jgi:3alpha(or 20beta)-hydroxysteroid dehydrogenase